MKIAVYDKKNQDRLLGHFDHSGSLYTRTVEDVITSGGIERVRFEFSIKSESSREVIDQLTTQVVTTKRKVLVTDEPLETLMLLSRFTLPEETREEANRRRYGDYRVRVYY